MEGKHSQTTEQFMESVQSIKNAEEEARRIREKAEEHASSIILQAKERAVEVSVKASSKALNRKNAIVANGKKKTDVLAKAILAKASKSAEIISRKRLSDAKAGELAASIDI